MSVIESKPDLVNKNKTNYCVDIVSHDDVSYYVLGKNESNLLVFGYVRILFIEYSININIMPLSLIDLFSKFYYEIMPSFLSTDSMSINYERCEILRDEDVSDKVYCVSQIGWNHGIHEFKIKCIELGNKSHSIGIVSNRDGFIKCSDYWFNSDWSFDSATSGITYQIYFNNQENFYWNDAIYIHDEGKRILTQKTDKRWKVNDIISFKINCNEWILTFYINNKQIGDRHNLIKNKKYYAAIGIGGDQRATLQFIE